jgi:hypothetical protein
MILVEPRMQIHPCILVPESCAYVRAMAAHVLTYPVAWSVHVVLGAEPLQAKMWKLCKFTFIVGVSGEHGGCAC